MDGASRKQITQGIEANLGIQNRSSSESTLLCGFRDEIRGFMDPVGGFDLCASRHFNLGTISKGLKESIDPSIESLLFFSFFFFLLAQSTSVALEFRRRQKTSEGAKTKIAILSAISLGRKRGRGKETY